MLGTRRGAIPCKQVDASNGCATNGVTWMWGWGHSIQFSLVYWAQVLIAAFAKKLPWELTNSPKDFLKTLFLNTFPFIGYQTYDICYYWNSSLGVGHASNCAMSAIRITAMIITFHWKWTVLVDYAFSLKRHIYTPDVLIFTIIM